MRYHAHLSHKYKEFYRNGIEYILSEIKIINVKGIPSCPLFICKGRGEYNEVNWAMPLPTPPPLALAEEKICGNIKHFINF